MWSLLVWMAYATAATDDSVEKVAPPICQANTPPRGYVSLEEYVPLARLTYRNYGADNPMGAPLPGYGARVMWLRKEAADKLLEVTQDLASFWADGYAVVKAELKGRYPKHYWPSDPLEAEPTNRAKPREGKGGGRTETNAGGGSNDQKVSKRRAKKRSR